MTLTPEKRAKHQEYFDKVWDHFVVKKGPPSISRDNQIGNGCMLLNPDGAKCAISILLTDELREKVVAEGHNQIGVVALFDNAPEIEEYFKEADVAFLASLQVAHDAAAGMQRDHPHISFHRDIAERLIKTANHWGLKVPIEF